MDQEEKLNWDKLLKHIENQEDIQNEEELNQQELEMLLLAEEINMSLQEIDPKLKFPVQEGWEELKLKYEEKTMRSKRYKLYRMLAIAAVLLLIIGQAAWLFLQQNEVTEAVAGNQIQLTLGNGKTIGLDASHSEILKSEGAVLNGSNLIYKPETNTTDPAKQISTNTLKVPFGKYTRLELGDGTVVWLNGGSKLGYPTPFAADKREVTLEGEAYFDVSHDVERPFVVQLKELNLKVLGTAFGINTLGNVVHTALERGKVVLQAGSESLYLLPGELGTYDAERKSLNKAKADLRLYTAWKDLDVYFNNNTLQEITARLEREYDLDFRFENEALKNLHFTIDMPRTADFTKILNNIKLSSNEVDFVVEGRNIRVKNR
ncbi:FecR family protein [Pedobacter nyackensis]|uniref:FecR family protein n=1 Tax=Pedobacter nyackensis TaxID=475255 RepID=UPI00292EA362|nr:FecR domain-containing protein [Pedobacter nyackensis]